jgi:hypothetical protein
VNQIRKWLPDVGLANVRLHATGVAPDYADAMFNLALLLQRTNQYAEAADYWRRYLARDGQSERAARARRSLKFCEMQIQFDCFRLTFVNVYSASARRFYPILRRPIWTPMFLPNAETSIKQ